MRTAFLLLLSARVICGGSGPLKAAMRARPDAYLLAEACQGGRVSIEQCQVADSRALQQTALRLRGGGTRKKEALAVKESPAKGRAVKPRGLVGRQEDETEESAAEGSDTDDEEEQGWEDGSGGDDGDEDRSEEEGSGEDEEEEQSEEEGSGDGDDEEEQSGKDSSAGERKFSKIGTMAVSVLEWQCACARQQQRISPRCFPPFCVCPRVCVHQCAYACRCVVCALVGVRVLCMYAVSVSCALSPSLSLSPTLCVCVCVYAVSFSLSFSFSFSLGVRVQYLLSLALFARL